LLNVQLKIKFNKTRWLRGWIASPGCLAAMALLAAPAIGQPLVRAPTTEARPSASSAPRAYRDGSTWVQVMRAGTRTGALDDLVCRREDRSFRASVGASAIVQFAPGVSAPALLRRHALGDSEPISPRLRIHRVRGGPDEDGVDVAARLTGLSGIVSAVPDLYIARRPAAIAVPPNDPLYSAQWYLDHLQIESAWRHTTGSRAVAVVVIDGGCDMDHPDLAQSFVGGRDLVDGDDDPSPIDGSGGDAHGTACAGLIAATGDNGVGIAGVCPECALHCVRLYGAEDKALVPISADIAAFEYAFEVGAAVVSNSWGFADPMPVPEPLRAVIESLIDEGRSGRGALVVFAAGNENRELGGEELVAVEGVLNVGAVNNFDEAAPFSNFGPSLDLTAPTGTFTTDISGSDGYDPGDYTDLFGGTSSACPVVAGVAALVLSASPTLTARAAAELLISTARPAPYAVADAAGHDPVYGHGIVDPGAAVRAALGLAPEDAGPADAGAASAADAASRDAASEERAVPRRDQPAGCSCALGGTGRTAGTSLLLLALVVVTARSRSRRRLRVRPDSGGVRAS
jgi:serine protease